MVQEADKIKQHIENERESLSHNLDEIEYRFKDATDLKAHFERNTGLILGAAVAGAARRAGRFLRVTAGLAGISLPLAITLISHWDLLYAGGPMQGTRTQPLSCGNLTLRSINSTASDSRRRRVSSRFALLIQWT